MAEAPRLAGEWSVDDLLPEFGTLAVRDDHGPEVPAVPGEELLELWALEGVATIARAGAGWCDAGAGDGPISVRMQRWTAEPPLPPGLDDLVETPYRARHPRVRPAHVTGGFLGEGLDLGAAGLHRLRIGRTLGERGRDAWLLQFWPVPRATAPRWWVRSRPPANHRAHQWWRFLDDWTAQELAQFVFAAGGGRPVTPEEVAGFATAHHRSREWLDEPLWSDPGAVLPLEHPERDALFRSRLPDLRVELARRGERWAGHAEQLGAPAPVDRRDLLDLLVAAGVLETRDGRFRAADRVPRVQDVVDLPADRVAELERAEDHDRFLLLATDLVSIALWAGSEPTTTAELAGLLLAGPDDVRGALAHAVRVGRLRVDGDRDARFRLVATEPPTR